MSPLPPNVNVATNTPKLSLRTMEQGQRHEENIKNSCQQIEKVERYLFSASPPTINVRVAANPQKLALRTTNQVQ